MDYKNFVVDPVDLAFGSVVLLKNTKLNVQYKEHYGILGKNGIGKTSLLNAIAKRILPIPIECDMVYVQQEEPVSDTSVLDTLLMTDENLYRKKKELEHLEEQLMGDATDEVVGAYEALSREIGNEGDKMRVKGIKILVGLGFLQTDLQRPVKAFSGGWRMRVALAKALFMTPTLLLLDEPTNHLDLHANLWLASYLKTYPKTLMVVSHDHYFIDEVCTVMVHLHDQKLHYYKGNYTKFKRQRTLEEEKAYKTWKEASKKIEKMKKAHRPKKEIQAYILKQHIVRPPKDNGLHIAFQEPPHLHGLFLTLEDVVFGYEKPLFSQPLTLEILPGHRMALVGKNGVGKSTLLKLLVGDLVPFEGQVLTHHQLRIGYYNQHFAEGMDLTLNSVEYLMQHNADLSVTDAHKYLSLFGLDRTHHKTALGHLSGGQKARVKLASFGVCRPHILILDEPTNHLDMDALDNLTEALQTYEGAIVLVTHHFDLLSQLECELWVVDEMGIERFHGEYQDYIDETLSSIDSC